MATVGLVVLFVAVTVTAVLAGAPCSFGRTPDEVVDPVALGAASSSSSADSSCVLRTTLEPAGADLDRLDADVRRALTADGWQVDEHAVGWRARHAGRDETATAHRRYATATGRQGSLVLEVAKGDRPPLGVEPMSDPLGIDVGEPRVVGDAVVVLAGSDLVGFDLEGRPRWRSSACPRPR